ncbi:FkbM family methyltransferase [Nitrosopumilus adriaticus]|uniref:FkbM family methyltransferase n=1 Tax=Nitrosopumilus adriaticus TaxID=1580092 RepID=UPI00352DE855
MNKIQLTLKARKIFINWRTLIGLYFKTIKNQNVILETRNNIKIKIRTDSTDIMQVATVWLAEDYKIPEFYIKENDIIIDIGAHIGLFCLYTSQYCKNGKVFCYEPIKKNFDILTENLELNNIKNIIPFNSAVSNQNNKTKIFLNSDDSAHSIFDSGKDSIYVKSTTIKSIFDENEIENCNLLKLDCEGAEYQIIDSITPEYYTKIDKIIIEYHMATKNLELYKKLLEKLVDNSFKIRIEKISEDMGVIYAVK